MKKIFSIILATVMVMTLLTSCAAVDKVLTSVYLNLGEKYLTDLNYEKAIVYFNKLIEVESKNSKAYIGEAEAYVGLGDVDSAIEILQTALDIFSDDEEVMLELFEMLMEIDASNSEWYISLFDIYQGRGENDRALAVLSNGAANTTDNSCKITLLEKLIEVDSATDDWYLELATVYMEDEDIDSAMSVLETGMEAATYTEEIQENLADCYSQMVFVKTRAYYYYKIGTLNYTIEYNEDGNRTKAVIYSYSTGRVSSTYTYEYDSNGNLIKMDRGNYWSEYEYDSNNNKVKETYYSSSLGVQYWIIWVYDADGNVLSETQYSDYYDPYYYYRYEYEYDDNGNMISFAVYNSEGRLCGVEEYEYDDNGLITDWTSYSSSDGTVLSTRDYEYDTYGRLLSWKEYRQGELVAWDMYEYDWLGNVVWWSYCDSGEDGEITYLFTYEYDYERDSSGKIVSKTTTEYYEDGAVSVIQYETRIN